MCDWLPSELWNLSEYPSLRVFDLSRIVEPVGQHYPFHDGHGVLMGTALLLIALEYARKHKVSAIKGFFFMVLSVGADILSIDERYRHDTGGFSVALIM
jgi:hypothetical protein